MVSDVQQAGRPSRAPGSDGALAAVTARARELIPAPGVIDDHAKLRTYECDGLTAHRSSPGLVVLPTTAEQVAAVVAACARAKIPFVARGSGTGLSGGALPGPTAC